MEDRKVPHIIVGSADCPIQKLVIYISKCSVHHILVQEKWSTFARHLGLNPGYIMRWERELNQGKKPHLDVLEEMIDEWKLKLGTGATLAIFLDAMRTIDCIATADCILDNIEMQIK